MIIRLKLIPTSIKIATYILYMLWIGIFVTAFVLSLVHGFSSYAWIALGAFVIINLGDLLSFLKSGFPFILKVCFWVSRKHKIGWSLFDGLPSFNSQQEDMAIAMEKALNVEKNEDRQSKSFVVLGSENSMKSTAVLQFLRSVMHTFTATEKARNRWIRDIIYMHCDHNSRNDINQFFYHLKYKMENERRLFSRALKNKLIIIDNAEFLGEEFLVKYKNILKHSLGEGSFVLIFNECIVSSAKRVIADINIYNFSEHNNE